MRYIFIIIGLLCYISAKGQNFYWRAGFTSITDNREYFNDLQDGKTIFGTRVNGVAGIRVDSIHHFNAGVNYMYENGGELVGEPVSPVIYYHVRKTPLDFYAGAFPREDLLNYPLALMKDSLRYYRPHIEGLYLQTSGNFGHEKLWIDWTSRQTSEDREAFMFGNSGQLNWKWAFFEHYFMMYHYAKRAGNTDDHIRDNGGAIGRVGGELSPYLPVDTFRVAAGMALFLDQHRGFYEMKAKQGFIADANIRRGIFGIKGTYFKGEGQEIIQGDNFYQANEYCRLDFFVFPVFTEHVTGRFMFSLHFFNRTIDHSQTLVLSMNIGDIF